MWWCYCGCWCRLIGCQDLLEEIPSRSGRRDNITTGATSPPDFKSLPRMSKSIYGGRGTAKSYTVREDLSGVCEIDVCLFHGH